MKMMEADDFLRLFYAAAEAVKSGEVGEVEFEQGEDEDRYIRITVRREPVKDEFHSVSNFGEGFGTE